MQRGHLLLRDELRELLLCTFPFSVHARASVMMNINYASYNTKLVITRHVPSQSITYHKPPSLSSAQPMGYKSCPLKASPCTFSESFLRGCQGSLQRFTPNSSLEARTPGQPTASSACSGINSSAGCLSSQGGGGGSGTLHFSTSFLKNQILIALQAWAFFCPHPFIRSESGAATAHWALASRTSLPGSQRNTCLGHGLRSSQEEVTDPCL